MVSDFGGRIASTAGTFESFNLARIGLAGGGTQERIAKATEESKETLDDISDRLDEMDGGEFE